MKAKALRPFTMGSAHYEQNQEMDLPEERVRRLVGEGLVATVEDLAPPPAPVEPPQESVPAEPPPAPTRSEHPAPKKGGNSRRRK